MGCGREEFGSIGEPTSNKFEVMLVANLIWEYSALTSPRIDLLAVRGRARVLQLTKKYFPRCQTERIGICQLSNQLPACCGA
jgi:hypothetical protein